MKYPQRHDRKHPDVLTDHERDVASALRDYRVTDDRYDSFTPTENLWQMYRNWYLRSGNRIAPPTMLTRNQFGMALRRVFDLGDDECVIRSVQGKRMRGYLCLVGPESINVGQEKGRRPGDHTYGII